MHLDLLHLHGFKCAGSTFIWSLERAFPGRLGYVESPGSGTRLDWRLLQEALPGQSFNVATSHLMTLPPPGSLARIKVAFLREPLARIASAYRFQRDVQKSIGQEDSFAQYVEGLVQSSLSNYQTRHLSPQEPADWEARKGWGARPELIDFERSDLFVGLVERYDDSIVVLEALLQGLGIQADLAYATAQNTTKSAPTKASELQSARQSPRCPFVTELDRSLYNRAEQRLERHIAAMPDFPARLAAFQARRAQIAQHPPMVRTKPPAEWLYLPAS